jgi:hypothetical protein
MCFKLGIQFSLAAIVFGLCSQLGYSQVATFDDPITAAQAVAARGAARFDIGAAVSPIGNEIADPIHAAQVLAAAERSFPNLAAELENGELLRKATSDPSIRGSLRGRIAEKDWIKRNSKFGWNPVGNPNAPQNDAYRFVNGRLEGAQVKVHADWHDYIRSMRNDYKAEKFVIPDDHYDLVYSELETRRVGALRGGLVVKAAEYERHQQRLTKMGRTFTEVDEAIGSAAKHYERIGRAIRAGGKAASFVSIALGLLDGGITVYQVATGRREVDELVTKASKVVIGGTASWALGEAGATAAAAAGATGAIPVAVAIVLSTGTYLVVDWAVDATAYSLRITHLSDDDIRRIWPNGSRGVPLDRLYQKPVDRAVLLKK